MVTVACVVIPLTISGGVVVYAFITKRWTLTQWLGATGILGLAGLIQLYWLIPVRRKVVAHRGKVCGDCLYVLNGLDHAGACPECGNTYDIDDTICGWEEDLLIKIPRDDSQPET